MNELFALKVKIAKGFLKNEIKIKTIIPLFFNIFCGNLFQAILLKASRNYWQKN